MKQISQIKKQTSNYTISSAEVIGPSIFETRVIRDPLNTTTPRNGALLAFRALKTLRPSGKFFEHDQNKNWLLM